MLNSTVNTRSITYTLNQTSPTYNPALCSEFVYKYIIANNSKMLISKINEEFLACNSDLALIDRAHKTNPLVLFTENTTNPLSRTLSYNRKNAEMKFAKAYQFNEKLNYTTFHPENLFQDLMLLSNILTPNHKVVNLNIIQNGLGDATLAFISTAFAPSSSEPSDTRYNIYYQRLVKLFEWFKAIFPNIVLTVNIFKDAVDFINEVGFNDNWSSVTVGIGYHPIYARTFRDMAISTTVDNGIILSMYENDSKFPFEMYLNKRPDLHIHQYFAETNCDYFDTVHDKSIFLYDYPEMNAMVDKFDESLPPPAPSSYYCSIL